MGSGQTLNSLEQSVNSGFVRALMHAVPSAGNALLISASVKHQISQTRVDGHLFHEVPLDPLSWKSSE